MSKFLYVLLCSLALLPITKTNTMDTLVSGACGVARVFIARISAYGPLMGSEKTEVDMPRVTRFVREQLAHYGAVNPRGVRVKIKTDHTSCACNPIKNKLYLLHDDAVTLTRLFKKQDNPLLSVLCKKAIASGLAVHKATLAHEAYHLGAGLDLHKREIIWKLIRQSINDLPKDLPESYVLEFVHSLESKILHKTISPTPTSTKALSEHAEQEIGRLRLKQEVRADMNIPDDYALLRAEKECYAQLYQSAQDLHKSGELACDPERVGAESGVHPSHYDRMMYFEGRLNALKERNRADNRKDLARAIMAQAAAV